MKRILKIVIFAVFITMLVVLNASAIYEIQSNYEEHPKSYYKDGLESDYYAIYWKGSWWWFIDATARSVITNQTGNRYNMSGHTYAEIKNGYDGHFDSNIEFGFDIVRTCEVEASIDDIYSTRNHHNCEFYYNNIYRYSHSYTVGEN